jgi:large subunit ribosomal protein L24
MKVRKGDRVVVLSGKDKGAEGTVLVAFPDKNKVIVEGVNVARRHQKPTRSNQQGGIVDKNMPIDASNVAVIGSNGKPTRVGYRIEPAAPGAKARKVRIDKRTGADLP